MVLSFSLVGFYRQRVRFKILIGVYFSLYSPGLWFSLRLAAGAAPEGSSPAGHVFLPCLGLE